MEEHDKVRVKESTTVASYAVLALVINIVNDGWSGRPSPLFHQLLLLPLSAVFFLALYCLLAKSARVPIKKAQFDPSILLVVCTLFEALFLFALAYERRHFARFGYSIPHRVAIAMGLVVLSAGGLTIWRRTGPSLYAGMLTMYAAGLLLAIRCFPLNYLRSDMLPVIVWGDERLLKHLNPYTTMHVGTRLYDFPYLPGMLLAFLPAVALRLDVRFETLACIVAIAWLIYGSARVERRRKVALLLALFVLSPFLQYRHDLYLQPHWLTITASIILLQRRYFGWAAALFGVSMGLYQLSWVIFPFFLLYAYRRGRWAEASRSALIGFGAMFLVVGPFLRSATQRIASNTVGQWGRMPHALADPINLSYWATFLVRPDQLEWVQLAVMTGIFTFCVIRNRCRTVTDTLRWMSWALAFFIALNVLVDGYFYLTLLLLLLMYTCAAMGIWPDPEASASRAEDHNRPSNPPGRIQRTVTPQRVV